MNAPFDPEETHDGDGPEREDPFGENSVTWGAGDPDFDRMLRDRLGPLPSMPTPPYAFERALLAGRRRRARKVWAAGATAALVVMAGTAGTTVALRGTPAPSGVVGPAATGTQSTSAPATPSFSASASPSPSASTTPSPSATTASASPTATAGADVSTSAAATVAQCHSDDMQLTVTVQSTVQSGSTSGSSGALLIVLRNNSAHACTMYGFPGLQTENVNEQLQSTSVKWDNGSTAEHLTVDPGGYVSTLATFSTVATSATAPPAGCGAPSYYLAVIPPNEQNQIAATIAGGPVTVCGNGVVHTGPMVPGKTGGH